MPQDVFQHTYPNGLTLLAERMDHVRSAAVNILVPAGAIYDVCGDTRIDYVDIIHTIKRAKQLRTPIVHIPFWLFKLLLKIYALFSDKPPFTASQLDALTAGDERLRARPAPDVVVSAMAESSVNLALRFWLRDPHTEVPIDLEYVERVKKALDEAGIQIPYPTRSLYVERLPAGDPGPGGPADGVRGPGRPESPAGGKTP